MKAVTNRVKFMTGIDDQDASLHQDHGRKAGIGYSRLLESYDKRVVKLESIKDELRLF